MFYIEKEAKPRESCGFFLCKIEKRVAFYVNSFYTKTRGWGKVVLLPIKKE